MAIVGTDYCSRWASHASDGRSSRVARVAACEQSRPAVLIVLTTHPIQYQVPLWQAIAADGAVPFEVWFMTDHGARESLDQEFGRAFAWDLDLLSGYPSRFLEVARGASPPSFWRCRLQERLRSRLVSSGASALWIQGWQVAGYWQAVREARTAGVPIWLRGESNDLAPNPVWKRLIKAVPLRWLFRQVDDFLCIGSANKRLYRSYGVGDSRLHLAPYAVDNDRFARQAKALRAQRGQLRRQWAIPEDAFCVLFCGKFIPKKRPLDLIAAAELLERNGGRPEVHLLFVGSGELDAPLRKACNVVFDSAGMPSSSGGVASTRPSASFTGFLNQTEISQAYVAADCLVLPSDSGETWGLVVNEALASGLPCIVSDECGCAEDLSTPSLCESFRCGDLVGLARRLDAVGRRGAADLRDFELLVARHSFTSTVETVKALVRTKDALR